MYTIIWLVNSSLYFYLVTSEREFSNCKKKWCQGRNQWCQQITVQEHIFGEFAIVHLTFGTCTSPTDTFHFTYHSFIGPGMCSVDNFRRLRFGSLPTSSQESVKHKSTFMFTFTLCTIYEANITAQNLESCWPATNNNAILAALLQHKEDNFSKMTDKNRSEIDRNKSVPKKW